MKSNTPRSLATPDTLPPCPHPETVTDNTLCDPNDMCTCTSCGAVWCEVPS